MEYIIRKCVPSDLPSLIKLCSKHAEYEQASYSATGKEDLLGNAIFSNLPKIFCYVVEGIEKLEGYFSYTFDFSTWDAQTFIYLDCLYLEPEYRGHKIGQQVFELLKEIAKKNDCVNIQWQTPIYNERAISFYHRMGGIGKQKMRFSSSNEDE
jgi:GNAT superfamily N-acetyltransferase